MKIDCEKFWLAAGAKPVYCPALACSRLAVGPNKVSVSDDKGRLLNPLDPKAVSLDSLLTLWINRANCEQGSIDELNWSDWRYMYPPELRVELCRAICPEAFG